MESSNQQGGISHLKEGRVSAKVGLDEKEWDFSMVNTIGDKVLLKCRHFERM